jgi:hypothetical protein
MTNNARSKIIAQGIENLRQYGYHHVDEQNILTDEIYSKFFKSMLESNLGRGHDELINSIITDIK